MIGSRARKTNCKTKSLKSRSNNVAGVIPWLPPSVIFLAKLTGILIAPIKTSVGRCRARVSARAGLLIFFAILVSGCGTPGAPLPPSLRLPKPVDDLQAIRKGNKVLLSWRQPIETTDRQGIKGETVTRICRSYRTQVQASCQNVVAELKSSPSATASAQRVQQIDDLTNILRNNNSQDYVIYNVEVANDRGRTAGPSNAVTVFLAPSLSPATDVRVSLPRRDAIIVEWDTPSLPQSSGLNTKYEYQVLRAAIDQPAGKTSGRTNPKAGLLSELPAVEGPQSYLDKTFEWEKTYNYRLAGVTQVFSREGKLLSEFEGDDSPTVQIVAHDIFPPEPPKGLQAVFTGAEGGNYIDLSWSPSDESDIAGYNIYRNEGSQPSTRINTELLKSPTFRDHAAVIPGKSFSYRVTAVDARGNESKPSAPATERVP